MAPQNLWLHPSGIILAIVGARPARISPWVKTLEAMELSTSDFLDSMWVIPLSQASGVWGMAYTGSLCGDVAENSLGSEQV